LSSRFEIFFFALSIHSPFMSWYADRESNPEPQAPEACTLSS
jgi:hypothetical protein